MKSLNDLTIFNDNVLLDDKGEKAYARVYLHKPSIQPYLIYSVLKNVFGLPNPKNTDEPKVQWLWTFSYSDFRIEIYDWHKEEISIAIYRKDADGFKSKQLAETITSFLEKNTDRPKSKLKSKIKESTHKFIKNPFITYYQTAENLIIISEQLNSPLSPQFVQLIENTNITPSYIQLSSIVNPIITDQKSSLYRSAFLMFFSSFEGFLNILFELYLKKELRETRLYDKISKENIDVKLRMIPIYCDGFKTVLINMEDIRFRDYQKLVELRNDYVHAKLVKSNESYIIKEDNYTFFVEDENSSKNPIPKNINNLELKHIQLAKSYIDGIIELVLDSMKPKIRKEFESIIYDEEIEVQIKDGVYMVV